MEAVRPVVNDLRQQAERGVAVQSAHAGQAAQAVSQTAHPQEVSSLHLVDHFVEGDLQESRSYYKTWHYLLAAFDRNGYT
jgi:hypothetical protein